MGKRGPKKEPKVLKLVSGDLKRAARMEDDQSTDPIGEAPDDFNKESRSIWDRMAKQCSWFREGDRDSLDQYCRLLPKVKVASKAIDKWLKNREGASGETVLLHRFYLNSEVQISKLLGNLGCTPTARAGVKLGGTKEKSEKGRFFASA